MGDENAGSVRCSQDGMTEEESPTLKPEASATKSFREWRMVVGSRYLINI